ncbi:TPA: acyltransferase [Vibrio cholerae]
MLRLYRYFKWKIKYSWDNYKLEKNGASIGWGVKIYRSSNAIITIKNGSVVGNGTIISCTNEGAINVVPKFVLGEGSTINESCNIRASGGEIVIGKKSMIANNVSIIATNHIVDTPNYMSEENWDISRNKVVIGDDVWIGCHSVILPGVTIADGAVIGAGSIVAKNVGKNEVFVGYSSRMLRKRNESRME